MTSKSIQAKTAMALVAGAAVVGAGVGLLFSPLSGAENRREVERYAKQTQDEATRLSRSIKGNMDKALEYSKSLLPKKEERTSSFAI